ncbi:MAG: hypothetical protein LBF26_02465 [Puniceicoccales bacterium]|nr:hypothetical protein [Puniceicoccales bacterium]
MFSGVSVRQNAGGVVGEHVPCVSSPQLTSPVFTGNGDAVHLCIPMRIWLQIQRLLQFIFPRLLFRSFSASACCATVAQGPQCAGDGLAAGGGEPARGTLIDCPSSIPCEERDEPNENPAKVVLASSKMEPEIDHDNGIYDKFQYPLKCVSSVPLPCDECGEVPKSAAREADRFFVVPYFGLGGHMSVGLVSHIMPGTDGSIVVTHEGCMKVHEFVGGLHGAPTSVVNMAYESVTQMVVGMGDTAKRQWILLLVVALCNAKGKYGSDLEKERQLQNGIGELLSLSQTYKTPTEARNDAEVARAMADKEEADARCAAAHKVFVEASSGVQVCAAESDAEVARIRREQREADAELRKRLEKLNDGFFVMLGKRLFRSS